MNTAIATLQPVSQTQLWDDSERINEVRKLFAPKLSDNEFKFFIGLGKATGLNPFLREIWAVKYQDNVPAQVFIGRDGYRKAAQSHDDYEWHEPDSIYENDVFEKVNGEIRHKYNLKDRGQLIGAYCLVKRKSSQRPVCIRVLLEEYSTGKSLWNSKPETMIKKVAEAQALRLCFQDLLGGTYSDAEYHKVEAPPLQVVGGNTQTAKLNNLLGIPVDVTTGEIINDSDTLDNRNRATAEQLERIDQLIDEKKLSEERLQKAFKLYEITELEQLTAVNARKFIFNLEKI